MEEFQLYAVVNRNSDGTVVPLTSGRNRTPSVYTTLGSARRQASMYVGYKGYNPFILKITLNGVEEIPHKGDK